jgi:hypothetical protein
MTEMYFFTREVYLFTVLVCSVLPGIPKEGEWPNPIFAKTPPSTENSPLRVHNVLATGVPLSPLLKNVLLLQFLF